MGDTHDTDLGRRAYETYRSASGGRSTITHQELPDWELLPKPAQQVWRVFAHELRKWWK